MYVNIDQSYDVNLDLSLIYQHSLGYCQHLPIADIHLYNILILVIYKE